MSGNPLRLKVAYLYPDILHGFCDRANVETFAKRASWRDVEVKIHEIYANDKVHSSKYDFFYIGGSNLWALEDANKFLNKNQEDILVSAAAGVPMLAVNCGYILFGKSWQLHNKIKVDGLNILDVDSFVSKNHHFGNISGACEFLRNKSIVGYENHSIITTINEKASPFITVKKGLGNNGRDKTEGAKINNVIGTYLTSPILAQNPNLCDFFIATALRVKYRCRVPLTRLTDDIEWYSHNFISSMK